MTTFQLARLLQGKGPRRTKTGSALSDSVERPRPHRPLSFSEELSGSHSRNTIKRSSTEWTPTVVVGIGTLCTQGQAPPRGNPFEVAVRRHHGLASRVALLDVLVAGLFVAACGGSPTVPTAVAPAAWAVGGRVTATLTGEGLGGVRLTSGTLEASTDADGRFTFRGTGPGGVLSVVAEHPNLVPRRTQLAWAQARDDIKLDLIRNSDPFSLEFYRQFARDGMERPGALQPLRRWTIAPMWYLVTTTEDTREAVSEADLERVEAAVRATVPAWTGGAFAVAVVQRGTAPPTQSGWMIVRFEAEPDPSVPFYCGRSTVGANPGSLTLVNGRNCLNFPSGVFNERVVAHEVGHAMGFWHVAGFEQHVMGTVVVGPLTRNATTFPSDAERHHARIAYARQPGNTDPDNDPTTVLPLSVHDPTPVMVYCSR